MDSIIKRILYLIEKSDINDKQLLHELDISNPSTISDWRSGKSKSPSIKNVIKFANYFDVSTDYLLLGKKQSFELSDTENEWLELFNQLSDHDKIECIGFIKGYIAARNSAQNENG